GSKTRFVIHLCELADLGRLFVDQALLCREPLSQGLDLVYPARQSLLEFTGARDQFFDLLDALSTFAGQFSDLLVAPSGFEASLDLTPFERLDRHFELTDLHSCFGANHILLRSDLVELQRHRRLDPAPREIYRALPDRRRHQHCNEGRRQEAQNEEERSLDHDYPSLHATPDRRGS